MSEYHIDNVEASLEEVEVRGGHSPYEDAVVAMYWTTEVEDDQESAITHKAEHEANVEVTLVDYVVVATKVLKKSHQVERVVLATGGTRKPTKYDKQMSEYQWGQVRKEAALFAPDVVEGRVTNSGEQMAERAYDRNPEDGSSKKLKSKLMR